MTAYLTTSDAQALAATLPGLEIFLAKDDASQAALLLLASMDIDRRKRYQGRKYDPTQGNEFPRIHGDGLALPPIGSPEWAVLSLPQQGVAVMASNIWDWDPAANDGQGGAVVPDAVKYAALYQANWLAQPQFAKRLAKIRSGLTSQGIGSASETYAAAAVSAAMASPAMGLCEQAAAYLEKYRLSGGPIL